MQITPDKYFSHGIASTPRTNSGARSSDGGQSFKLQNLLSQGSALCWPKEHPRWSWRWSSDYTLVPAVFVLEMKTGIAPVRDRVVLDYPPVPTNVVPMNRDSAWFWWMGMSCPLQSLRLVVEAHLWQDALVYAAVGVAGVGDGVAGHGQVATLDDAIARLG
jgi:hypothetical protein